jgi:hypothetical protein
LVAKLKGARDSSATLKGNMMSLNRERNDAAVAAAKVLVALNQRRRSPRVKLGRSRRAVLLGATCKTASNSFTPQSAAVDNNSEIRRT